MSNLEEQIHEEQSSEQTIAVQALAPDAPNDESKRHRAALNKC